MTSVLAQELGVQLLDLFLEVGQPNCDSAAGLTEMCLQKLENIVRQDNWQSQVVWNCASVDCVSSRVHKATKNMFILTFVDCAKISHMY